MAEFLTHDETGGGLRIKAGGDWTVANAARIEAALDGLPAKAAGRISIDMAGIGAFDSFGAWLLERFRRERSAAGAKVTIDGLPARNEPIFHEISEVNRQQAEPQRPRGELHDIAAEAGNMFASLGRDLVSFAVMTGAVVTAFATLFRQPRDFRLTSSVSQFDRIAWQAVPIIVMITFLIGAILAQQGFFHFSKFGADLYVVDMVGFLITRELGVLLVAIMVAGRTGSAFTAELGSMKMREEIDALRTMGLDPVAILILPRVLVLVAALPVLTFIGSMSALYGAGLVSTVYGGMTTELFMERLREAITVDHFLVGMIKAPVIGFFIGIIACNEGFSVHGSAASLGRHTTQSVVKSIFMVIVLDAMFAIFFSAIGM
ncbi:MAG: MlaE family lipid ABC transporter permease subunit [Nitratireductor sp.]|jgi:phospholipid/cholesterol/gamma-HCH transport system permease protein|nr:MlaE family lipid ABC transporter permease subunit [Nitratireductor sp.]